MDTIRNSELFDRNTLRDWCRSDDVRQQLKQAGVRMTRPDQGRLGRRRFSANVAFEADECVRVRAAIKPPACSQLALERHADAPGNVRYARGPEGWSVVAETRLDGVEHLSASLDEISHGIRSLIRTKAIVKRVGSPSSQTPRTSLETMIQHHEGLRADAVEIESGWELRPRVAGHVVPVEVRADSSGMQVAAVVLRTTNDPCTARAIADQALRLNAQFRLARLSVADGTLRAESYLRSELVSAEWLEVTSRAVATACHIAGSRLSLLMETSLVAERYVELFLDA